MVSEDEILHLILAAIVLATSKGVCKCLPMLAFDCSA